MNKVKKDVNPTLIWLGVLIIYIVLFSLLNYFGVIKSNTIITINLVIVAVMMLLLGISRGKKASKKGYLEGIKFGLIVCIILIIINLIFLRVFHTGTFIYYITILLSSTFGSIIGINLHK